MVSIDERITKHEIKRRKLNNRKDVLESELRIVNEKIIYHWAAIQNLNHKKGLMDE